MIKVQQPFREKDRPEKEVRMAKYLITSGMGTYQVGGTYDYAVGHEEGPVFEITDCGGLLPIYLDHPSLFEIEQITQTESPIRMAVVRRKSITMLLVKFGQMEWMYIPYNPYLSIALLHNS